MINQNVRDRVIQHVCKHKPYAPMLLAIYADHIETVYCAIAEAQTAVKPFGLTRQHEELFAHQFVQMMRSRGTPLYLVQAGVVSLINDVGNPNAMHVCMTDIEGKDQVNYTAKLKSCLCCFETLTQAPGWKNTPFMLGQVVMAYRNILPTPAPVYSKPASEVKFSRN